MEPLCRSGPQLRFANLPDSHFIHRAQMRVLACDDRADVSAVVEIDVSDENTNGAGGLQGGMVATLVDCAAGQAIRQHVDGGVNFTTRDLTVHYLAPLSRGPARALARVRRAGKRSIVIQVDVVDRGAEDRLCAIATLTFAVLVDMSA